MTDFRTGHRRAITGFVLLLALVTAACAPASPAAAEPSAALRDAAERGDAAAVRTLLDQGAPVAVPDDRGATALVRAAYGNHVDVAALLVQAGADVDLQDESRQSARI